MEPTPIPFTMETLGWQIVVALFLILIAFVLFKWYQNYQKNQYVRTAVHEIQSLPKNLTPAEFITQTMFWVKQVALQSYGRSEVAALSGDKWVLFLDEKGKSDAFAAYKESIFLAIYKGEAPENKGFDKVKFRTNCINWIQNHAR
jgi:hypothetical protein